MAREGGDFSAGAEISVAVASSPLGLEKLKPVVFQQFQPKAIAKLIREAGGTQVAFGGRLKSGGRSCHFPGISLRVVIQEPEAKLHSSPGHPSPRRRGPTKNFQEIDDDTIKRYDQTRSDGEGAATGGQAYSRLHTR
jgi:hypothetical protein